MRTTDIGRDDKNGNPAWLAASAARSIRRVDAALGFILAVTWAGRTYAEQNALWLKYGKDPKRAARPGTSLHEQGRSIDIPTWLITARIVAVLLDHGWKQTVKGEPWHFTYSTARDNHLNDPAPTGARPRPLPPLPEGTTMSNVKQMHTKTRRAVYVPGTPWQVPFTENGATYANRLAASLDTGDSIEVTESLFDAILAAGTRCAPRDALAVELATTDA